VAATQLLMVVLLLRGFDAVGTGHHPPTIFLYKKTSNKLRYLLWRPYFLKGFKCTFDPSNVVKV
jgi:hypothetical protein